MKKLDAKHCAGCHDDFYNGHNNLGVSECWMRTSPHAAVRVRFFIGVNDPMGARANYRKEMRPGCYKQQRGIYVDRIPDYAR